MNDAKHLRERLQELAQNLWWTWHPEAVALFRELDPDLWRQSGHNPVAFLEVLTEDHLLTRARSLALESRIHSAFYRLEGYMKSRETWGAKRSGSLRAHPVAYFSAEFGLHESLPLYSGGLGVLAGDHVKAASDLDIPFWAVGLFYVQGYFIQRLDERGWQREEFGTVDSSLLPVRKVASSKGTPLVIEFPADGTIVRAQIWEADVGRARLLMLDTDLPENPKEWREITHRLYWGDQNTRIKQEIVLGVGGLRALDALGVRPGVLHLNEGHSAFALLEAIRQVMTRDGISLDEAKRRVRSRSLFTTHTPVPAGHDRFPPELVETHLGWMRTALGLTDQEFLAFGREDPTSDSETFCMTVLALKLAGRKNGVSAVHGTVSRRMWGSLWPDREEDEIPIGHVTNGVHTDSWMAPQVALLLERYLGAEWRRHLAHEETWRGAANVPPHELWETHQVLKAQLQAYVRRRVARHLQSGRTVHGIVATPGRELIQTDALVLGFARRFATYKRATLMFRQKERLAGLLNDPARPVQLVFAGKAHPRDDWGKQLIQEIALLHQDPRFMGRIVFVEDYDISVARNLVQGVDVWINNPRRPEEACGTSGMKAALNGVLNLSILDGWWAEAFDGRNGFAIDSPGPHSDHDVQDVRDMEALFSALETEVIPLFYDRDESGLPIEWIERMKWALMTLAWRYSAERMVRDYAERAYFPAAGSDTCLMATGI